MIADLMSEERPRIAVTASEGEPRRQEQDTPAEVGESRRGRHYFLSCQRQLIFCVINGEFI